MAAEITGFSVTKFWAAIWCMTSSPRIIAFCQVVLKTLSEEQKPLISVIIHKEKARVDVLFECYYASCA